MANAEPSSIFDLANRLAVVIGASGGIGRSLAKGLASAGAEVVLSSRDAHELAKVRDEIVGGGQRAEILTVDVLDISQIEVLADKVKTYLGDNNLELILVNSAGLDLTKPALQVTEEEWDLIHGVQLKAVFFACKAFAPLMIERGYGKIINLSSTWAFSTDPDKSVYCAAKAGVSHLTSALATEWAKAGIRVNAVAPSATLTTPTLRGFRRNPGREDHLLSHIPLNRFASPQDLVGSAVFLASRASDYITGHTLFVDGGWRGRA